MSVEKPNLVLNSSQTVSFSPNCLIFRLDSPDSPDLFIKYCILYIVTSFSNFWMWCAFSYTHFDHTYLLLMRNTQHGRRNRASPDAMHEMTSLRVFRVIILNWNNQKHKNWKWDIMDHHPSQNFMSVN